MSDYSFHTLSEADSKKIQEWLELTVWPAAVAKQKIQHFESNTVPSMIHQDCWDMGRPYSGAIGGSVTYCFTPNGIGTTFIVRESHTGMELDLSDYDSW